MPGTYDVLDLRPRGACHGVMDARRAVALVMAKMALSDGTITPEERSFLSPMVGEGEVLETLLTEARDVSVVDLAQRVERYADRFFVALRAATMAAIDDEIDAQEMRLYEELLEALAIRAEDQAVIQQSVQNLGALEPADPDPRIRELYEQSSFAN